MDRSFLKCALVVAAVTLAAACGGNVIFDSGNGGAGGATVTNACQHYADAVIAKYTQCGLEVQVGGSGGSVPCSAADGALAACLEGCVPFMDCGCTVDPTGPSCADLQKPYVDCLTVCVN